MSHDLRWPNVPNVEWTGHVGCLALLAHGPAVQTSCLLRLMFKFCFGFLTKDLEMSLTSFCLILIDYWPLFMMDLRPKFCRTQKPFIIYFSNPN